jgi:propionyl-CoA carboxylase beta chain
VLTNDQRRDQLTNLSQQAELGGGVERIHKQHEQGKYTARERINKLLDPESFIEFDKFVVHRCNSFGMEKTKFLGDGVVTGIGKINGQQVAIFSQDFTCWGGALGMAYAKKICKVMDFALENKIPVIGVNDSGGARIQEGVESLAGYADIFYRNVQASGVSPQISLIMGPCAGGAVYSPAMTDFIFMVDKTSYMFVTGPEVIKTVTHEEVTKDALGGAHTHNEKSGVAHFRCDDEDDCFERVRELFSFIPGCNKQKHTQKLTTDSVTRSNNKLKNFVPDNSKKPYDMHELILEVIDDQHFLEVHRDFAKNIITGFASIGMYKAGADGV